MRFWANLAGYQLVWFVAVIGASRGSVWPGVLLAAVFVAVQAACSATRRADLQLVVAAMLCGLLLDGGLAASGWATYASAAPAWPAGGAPVWILALWASFAMTFNHSLAYLRARPWLGAVFGLVGGPMAYWGAGRGWDAIVFHAPAWRGLTWLALGWAVAMFVLCQLGTRWERRLRHRVTPVPGGVQ